MKQPLQRKRAILPGRAPQWSCPGCEYRGPMAESKRPVPWYMTWCAFLLLVLALAGIGYALWGVLGALLLIFPVAIARAVAEPHACGYHRCPQCGVDVQWR